MNCKICSTHAKTLTIWNDEQPEHRKPVIYSVWQCAEGHHFYTQSKWDGLRYKTEFVDPNDMQFFKNLLESLTFPKLDFIQMELAERQEYGEKGGQAGEAAVLFGLHHKTVRFENSAERREFPSRCSRRRKR